MLYKYRLGIFIAFFIGGGGGDLVAKSRRLGIPWTVAHRLLCPRQTRKHMVASVRAPSGGSNITSKTYYTDLGL